MRELAEVMPELAEVVPRGDILFPVEVWKLVFEQLYDEVDQGQFAQVVGFLSALRHETEVLLYKKPLVAGITSAVRFAESISLSEPRARAVEALTIKITNRDNKRYSLYLDTLRDILHAVTRLVSIEFCEDLLRQSDNPPIYSERWALSMFLVPTQDRLPPLRSIRGTPVCLHADYAALLRVLGPRLEEVRLLSHQGAADEAVATLAGVDLPKLHTLACDIVILRQIKDTRNITHLWLMDTSGGLYVKEAIDLLGPQLVGLRIEYMHSNLQGPMYPTERPVRWDCCARLKVLHVDDIVKHRRYRRWSPIESYGYVNMFFGSKRVKLSHKPQYLPPVLETLIWAPAWVRNMSETIISVVFISKPDEAHRYILRRYAEDLLAGFSTLQEFYYMWSDEGYFHCMLSPKGDFFEAHMDDEHVDYNAWADAPLC